MIQGRWRDPNFKFSASEPRRRLTYFCYATSREALIKRLKGLHLTDIEVEEYDFTEWKIRAAKATQKAISDFEKGKRPIPFNQEIWSELKWHLFGLFHDKCAYCECPLGVTDGVVEHYRPKGKVKEDPGHPGYYWLAYDVSNLLPACHSCNEGFGKMNQFPVESRHALDAESLSGERPLLLNPYDTRIHPLQHLEFSATGEVIARKSSSLGAASIRCYYLDRTSLTGFRQSAIQRVRQDWNNFIVALASLPAAEVRRLLLQELKAGIREYSATQLYELARIVRNRGVVQPF